MLSGQTTGVGINTTGAAPDNSAILDVSASDRGILIPRVALTDAADATTVPSAANGLLVYNTATSGTAPNNVTPGFYFWDGSAWSRLVNDNGNITADNGLTKTGSNIRMGGTLLENSNIPLNDFNLTFSGRGGVGVGTATPASNTMLTINAHGTNTYRNGLDITMTSPGSNATGINISSGAQQARGFLYTNNSTGTSNVFWGTGSVLSGTNIVSGFTGYRTGSGVSYGLYGVNGTTSTYATNSNTWALFSQGRAVISSEGSPTSPLGTDLEIRNTTAGAGNPVTLSMRQSTSNATSGTVLANMNFGDNYVTSPQAQIQVSRGAAGGAGDFPTDISISTTPDASSTLTERMRITHAGVVRLNAYTTNGIVRTTGGNGTLSSSVGNINLTTEVTGVLPIANGGTNSTATPTNGGIAYGTGTAYAFTGAGVAGEVLQSNGAGVPTWVSGDGLFIRNQSAINQTANFRINGNGLFNGGRIGVGELSPTSMVHIVESANDANIAGMLINESNAGQALIINEAGNGTGILVTSNDNGAGIFSTVQGAITASAVGYVFNDIRTSSTASLNKIGTDIQSTGTWNGAGSTNNALNVLASGGTTNVGVNVNVSGGSTDYAALFNGGNVGIGTLTPVDRLDVRSAMSVNEVKFRNLDGGDDSDPYRLRKFQNSGNSNELQLHLNDDGDECFAIYGNSCVGFGCGEYSGNLYHFFRADGNAYHAGNVGIGTLTPNNRLHVGAGNGDGIMIGNFNDQLGWNGSGPAPEYAIRFAGYRDVVNNFTGAKIAAFRTEHCCTGLSQGMGLSFQTMAGPATVSGDGNLIERLRINSTGTVQVNNLAGTGNRAVYADPSGVLVAGSKNMVFLQDRNERTFNNADLGYRDASGETPNLPVNSGDVVIINFSGKFAFTGGSGNDDARFRLQVLGDCGTINLPDTYEYEDYDNGRNEYLPVGGYFVYTPGCSGNVRFKVQVDANSDADDAHKTGDIVIVAVKY